MELHVLATRLAYSHAANVGYMGVAFQPRDVMSEDVDERLLRMLEPDDIPLWVGSVAINVRDGLTRTSPKSCSCPLGRYYPCTAVLIIHALLAQP